MTSKNLYLNQAIDCFGLTRRQGSQPNTRKLIFQGQCVFEGTASQAWQFISEAFDWNKRLPPTIRHMLNLAIREKDTWACDIVYHKQNGHVTRRFISPVTILRGDTTVQALCAGRLEPRNFQIYRIMSCKLVDAAQIEFGRAPVEDLGVTK